MHLQLLELLQNSSFVKNLLRGHKKVFDFFLKGCGMGPMLDLVSPCFRKNVVATCKIGSFLCSLDQFSL